MTKLKTTRLLYIDALRGFALILMGLDHAAYFAQTGILAEHYLGLDPELSTISHWGTGLLTNIATPTFWFVSGISIALFVASRRRSNQTEWEITRFLLTRSFVIILLDYTIVGWIWGYSFNVLSSLGVSLALMSVIRLLPISLIFIMMTSLLFGYQWLFISFPIDVSQPGAFWQAMWLSNSDLTQPNVTFPVLGWIGLMGLGFVLGHYISKPLLKRLFTWLIMGTVLLLIWFLIRLSGSYGNIVPYETGQPLLYFFIMSKAPPSLVYLLFNLGLAFYIMAILVHLFDHLETPPLKWVVASGQASLFFYVAHLAVYRFIGESAAALLPNGQFPGIIRGYFVWGIGLVILIIVSYHYNKFRRKYPDTVLKYL